MADTRKTGLLERIEANVRGVPPLWFWLLFLTAILLPWLIGASLVAFLSQEPDPLSDRVYFSFVLVQCAVSMIIIPVMVLYSNRRYSGMPARQPDSTEKKLGVFQLGFGFFREIYRSWWNIPLFIGGLAILKFSVNFGDAGEEVYWDVMAAIGGVFAILYAGLGLLCLIGLFVRRKLRERDGAA